MRCNVCQTEVPARSRFCLHCGSPVPEGDPAATATMEARVSKPASIASTTTPTSPGEGRFPAGSLLGDRYRVIGLLGQGGMGEVYRATDLTLNQPVALKFLPEATAHDDRLLERFHGEVRIARQVSHPNVCRVYDIGKLDGAPYISMEYVDGEDLATLLRRIGRLPGDKAVEIARKLCAGLAAAHAKGVLHRDLKPSNIMLDARGQVLIMDFGLAAIAHQVEGIEVRNGTPAYMAPEQLAGREVTVRSDIYSLGLVLYEMFTGKKAFETLDRGPAPSASTVIKDIDPAVERLIQRCLDPDPAKRPASALAVARALPGGDPLAEALAAGDTPSPEMVAASEETGALSVRAAVLCLAFIVTGLIAVVASSSKFNLLRITPFPDPPDILARRARAIAAGVGYTNAPADTAHGFMYFVDYKRYAERNEKPEEYRAQIEHGQPPLALFWYRESPQELAPLAGYPYVSEINPPETFSGMVRIRLDPQGRLIFLSAVPPQVEDARAAAQPANWDALFAAAGLEQPRFTKAAPEWLSLTSFDERAAWTGAHAHAPSVPLRVEAAAWKGKPVYFQVIGPWTPRFRAEPIQRSAGQTAAQWLGAGLLVAVVSAALTLAWRNYRRGRGDLAGSARLAAFALGSGILQWLLGGHHVSSGAEFNQVFWVISQALLLAALFWVLYMALEPYVRRHWPQSLISWTRLLGGGVRDPLVGGHMLLGTALAMGFALLSVLEIVLRARSGIVPAVTRLATLLGVASAVKEGVEMLTFYIAVALGVFFLFFLLRAILRKNWLAAVVFVLLFVAQALLQSSDPLVSGTVAAVQYGFALWILTRFGVLPMILAMFLSDVVVYPLTSDLSAWYAGAGTGAVVLVLVVAGWSFKMALGGRKLWAGDFLET
jgi:predicted Ser/Thr protein kinase